MKGKRNVKNEEEYDAMCLSADPGLAPWANQLHPVGVQGKITTPEVECRE